MAVGLATSALVELEKSLSNTQPAVFPRDETVVIPAIVWPKH